MGSKERAGDLMTRAESIKKSIKKIEEGGNHSKEDTAAAGPITCEMLFGYSNEERQESKYLCFTFVVEIKEAFNYLNDELNSLVEKVKALNVEKKKAKKKDEVDKYNDLIKQLMDQAKIKKE
jgi:hypothetical protein